MTTMRSNHSSAPASDRGQRAGQSADAADLHLPMATAAMERLTAWFAGEIALTRAEAHRLLECAVEAGHVTQHRAEFVAAIKALAAGPGSWHDMGYRLLPDD